MRVVLLALLVAGLVGLPARTSANDALARDAGHVALAPCIKRAAAGDQADFLLANPQLFDCKRDQNSFGPGDFWVRIDVPADTNASFTVLRWSSVWQDSASIYALYNDGTRQLVELPSSPSGKAISIGAYYTVRLNGDGAPTAILFNIRGAANTRSILLNPQLSSEQAIARIDAGRSAIYAGFAGLCLALFAYNLMLRQVMRERYLLAYCTTVAAGLFYALTSSGTLALLMPEIDNNLRLRLNYLGLTAMALSAMWFARSFFGSVMIPRAFDRLLISTGTMLGLFTLIFVLLAPWQIFVLDRLYVASFTLFFIVGSSMFVRAWMRGGQVERLFSVAWAFPVVLNMPRLLHHGFGIIPQSFWLDNATLVAMGAEALLSSLIIGYRIRLVRQDRDLARADEAEALRLAQTDELTGLLNRRALMRAACPSPEQAGQYRLILIDIDHFKAINDSVGHSAGDAVLRKVAEVIRAALRPDVIAARIGGEEFALLFPTGNVDRRYYSSLLARIRALPPVGGQRITVSMGAANGWLGGTEGEWLALFRAADAALYEAKNSGRNRLIVAPRYREMVAAA